MVANKRRLYVALYPSGVVNIEERRYHWGFLIGPKNEQGVNVPGTRIHVKNPAGGGWVYEEVNLADVRTTVNLLGRILIAKIEDERRLINILRTVPVVQGDPNWRCRTWVANALEAVANDGKAVGTSQLNWREIEAVGRAYIGEKTAGGRYQGTLDIRAPRPLWDLLAGKEIFE